MHRYVLRLEALILFGVPAITLVLTGLGFLVAALYIALARDMEPAAAALTTGAICFAAAVVVSVIGWLVFRSLDPSRKPVKAAPARPGPDEHVTDAARVAMAVGEAVGGDLHVLARKHRYGMIGAALAAGFAVGVSPKLRRSLLKLLDG